MIDLALKRAEYVRRLEAAVPRVPGLLSGLAGIERVSVIGSYARGRRDLFTDLDLVVVWRTDLPLLERLKRLHALLDLGVDFDVLCYTPEEFADMRDEPFLRRALGDEIVLHETTAAR